MQAPTATTAVTAPVNIVTTTISGLLNTVLKPFAANTAPGGPAQTPPLFTVLAFARRELDQSFAKPALTVGQVADGMANVALTGTAAPTATPAPATYSGQPSIVTRIEVMGLRVLRSVTDFLGIDFATQIAPLISSTSPPFIATLGLNVRRTEFDGMPVYAISSGRPSGKYVVAVHGGEYIVQPVINHWLAYAAMARDTGATVIVPIYPLVTSPKGRAATVVPALADLISAEIEEHGAANVSVYGDSAGGAIALSAVQELVRRGAATPSRMVLISPVLDLTMSNPNISLIDDPILSVAGGRKISERWAGGLDLSDPLVSPLYGSLAGLPPTAVYSGSLDLLAADTLVLQDKALALGDADNLTFTLRAGEVHDWALGGLPISPESVAAQPHIYHQLGL